MRESSAVSRLRVLVEHPESSIPAAGIPTGFPKGWQQHYRRRRCHPFGMKNGLGGVANRWCRLRSTTGYALGILRIPSPNRKRMTHQLSIRRATGADHDAIRQVEMAAFGGDVEARLVDRLRSEGYARVELLAETNDEVVGHLLFSELQILTSPGVIAALSLAPLAVLPAFQKQGIGAALVREGLEICRREGHRIVIVLGHADYYPRFGFSAELARPIDNPFGASDSWMAMELSPGALEAVSGRVQYPPPFGT